MLMKTFRLIILISQLATVCLWGSGCSTYDTGFESSGPKNESQYDQIMRDRQDRWQLEDAGGGH